MTKTKKRLILDILYAAVAVAFILGVWSICAAVIGSEFILPNIGATIRAFPHVFENPDFWSGIGGTLLRSVIGYAISAALFFVTFFFATAYDGFRRVVQPVISIMRSLPAVAVTLLLILAAGSNGAPILLGILVIYPIMFSAAMARTASVPTELKEICVICGANKRQTFFVLWLPRLAGGLPETLSTAFSYNIKAVIGAEILAQTANSIGMLMKLSQIYLQPDILVAFVLVSVAVAVISEAVIRVVLGALLKSFKD